MNNIIFDVGPFQRVDFSLAHTGVKRDIKKHIVSVFIQGMAVVVCRIDKLLELLYGIIMQLILRFREILRIFKRANNFQRIAGDIFHSDGIIEHSA